ncbi:hypothetical protein CBD41_09715 [bacterium TMED181]|nr:hypothetical protein [Planctomycetota bacterium]OUW42156.1 MAG: hypothetical protein CBD41_09715 [bacterium TMED181]
MLGKIEFIPDFRVCGRYEQPSFQKLWILRGLILKISIREVESVPAGHGIGPSAALFHLRQQVVVTVL